MSLRSKLLVFSTFALQLVLGASVAEAQGWLADRSRAEGPGFRLGNFELHPGLGAEVGYDSNVILSDDTNRPERSSGILRITPHLFLSTIGPQRLEEARDGGEVALPTFDLRTGLSGSLYHYLASNAGNSNMSADADVAATILPERPFSVTVSGNFSRTIQPFTEAGAIGNDYARDQASAGARFQLQTKGGVLKGTAGYRFGADLFEGATFRFADNFDHTITTTSAWRFLPNTALLWDVQLIL
ncbi:MAG: hypothetical protein KC416_14285, partial [Myxococcales bacterium]|nr:hypothetical protein [Myxococcales bacterium]